MSIKKGKKSFFTSVRNNFIAGVVVLIPIGITVYLTLFFIKFSSVIIPKEINPNHYLPYNIPGVEILIAVLIITFIDIEEKLPSKYMEYETNTMQVFHIKDLLFNITKHKYVPKHNILNDIVLCIN